MVSSAVMPVNTKIAGGLGMKGKVKGKAARQVWRSKGFCTGAQLLLFRPTV